MFQDKFSDGNEIGHIDVGTVMRRVVPGVGYQYMVDVTKNEREVINVISAYKIFFHVTNRNYSRSLLCVLTNLTRE